MILRNKDEEYHINYEREGKVIRPLFILIGDSGGKLKSIISNNNTVLCHDCGGAFGEPYEGVTIKNGYFSVEHYGGSSWRWHKIITYKYSEIDNNWYLHKVDDLSYHSSNPEKINQLIKTEKDFGKVAFKNFDIYK